jgi:hypothetical protein
VLEQCSSWSGKNPASPSRMMFVLAKLRVFVCDIRVLALLTLRP